MTNYRQEIDQANGKIQENRIALKNTKHHMMREVLLNDIEFWELKKRVIKRMARIEGVKL